MSDVTLHLGDCLDVLPTLAAGSVDLLLADPPYGVGLAYGGEFQDTPDHLKQLLPAFLEQAQRVAKITVIPSGRFEIETWLMQNYPPRWRMCWYKGPQSTASPIGFSDFELMFVYGKDVYRRAHDYFRVQPEVDQDSGHPCPKPVGWATWIIDRLTKPGNTVMDCFLGRGTTGMAAVKLGRNFIGCELHPEYFAIAKRNIEQARAQLALPLFGAAE